MIFEEEDLCRTVHFSVFPLELSPCRVMYMISLTHKSKIFHVLVNRTYFSRRGPLSKSLQSILGNVLKVHSVR